VGPQTTAFLTSLENELQLDSMLS